MRLGKIFELMNPVYTAIPMLTECHRPMNPPRPGVRWCDKLGLEHYFLVECIYELSSKRKAASNTYDGFRSSTS